MAHDRGEETVKVCDPAVRAMLTGRKRAPEPGDTA
jgi:hypothetical protein